MITITEKAANELKRKLDQDESNVGIKLSVKKNGCSGFAYVLEYVTDPNTIGTLYESQGIKVWIDPKAQDYIGELTVDWVRAGLNESLTFTNSLEKDRCGCGESFRV